MTPCFVRHATARITTSRLAGSSVMFFPAPALSDRMKVIRDVSNFVFSGVFAMNFLSGSSRRLKPLMVAGSRAFASSK